MGGKEDAPFGGENIARRRRRYGWRFCACMQLKGWSKGVLKVCLVNYEREECVHIFLHEKGWAWAVGGGGCHAIDARQLSVLTHLGRER